jgi:hypothetical protein
MVCWTEDWYGWNSQGQSVTGSREVCALIDIGGWYGGGPIGPIDPSGGGSSGGGGQTAGTQQNQQKPCPPDAKALAEVDKLLQQSGLDKLIDTKKVSKSGKGYILTFSDPDSVNTILGDKTVFAGGGSGGSQFHQKELRENFGPGGTFADFRSLKNGPNPLSKKRSLQVDTYTKDGTLRGGYVDTDRFSTKQNPGEAILHGTLEVAPYILKKAAGRKC